MNLRLRAIKDVFKMITTRSGDKGMTSLYSGERRSKDDVAFDCLGDADEFTCSLGVVRAGISVEFKEDLHHIQKRLLAFSAQVATKSTSPLLMKTIDLVDQEDINWLEEKQMVLLENVEILLILIRLLLRI